jgi:nucleoside-diphosphate-sugar epimerase
MAESACRFYSDNFHVKITIFRPFNVYGPGQSDRFLVSEIVSKVLDPAIHTVEVMDLRPKRDYVYLDDFVRAMIMSLDGLSGIYNIGSGVSNSVEEIIILTMDLAGIAKEYRSRAVSRPNEIFDLYADIGHAATELGWSPEVSLAEGLNRCIRAHTKDH